MNVRGTVRAASSVVSAILLFAPLNWPKTAFAAPASQWGDDVGTAEAGEKEEKEEKEEKTPAPPVKPEAEGSGLNAESASKTETKGSKLQTKKIEKKKKKKKKKKKRSRSGGAKSQQSKGVLEDEQAAFESATLAGEGALESRFAAEKAAKEKVDAGQDLEAAAELMAAADLGADPALMVSAAETAVAVLNTNRNKRSSQAKGALTAEQRSRAREAATRYASRAQGRLSELEGDHDEFAWLRLGLDRTDLEGLRSRAAAVLAAATQDSAVATPSVSVPVRAPVAERVPRSLRVARGEIISGAVLIGLGVSGFALMGSGLRLNALADRELEAAGIADLDELTPAARVSFGQQYEQAATLTAVGVVLGIAGSALGGTLMAAGIRDRKRAVAIQATPSLSLSRACLGLIVGGRF